MKRVRIGVIGAGGWGRNHLRVLRSLPQVDLVGFADADAARREAATSEHGVAGFADLEALAAEGLDGVTLAVPTASHRDVALRALESGLHVMVEKPIAGSLADADAIIDAARRRSLILHVGHVERWNAAFEALRERCARPRFIEIHRLAPFNPRGTDVAVVLDLMIHDLDLVLALVGEPITNVDAVGVAVLSAEIDIANARLEFASGAIANLTASRISREKVRKLRVFETDAYVAADLVSRKVECFRKIEAPGRVPPFRIEREPVQVPDEEPLTRELRAFARSVGGSEAPGVSGEQGRDALSAAVRILERIEVRSAQAGTAAWPGATATGDPD